MGVLMPKLAGITIDLSFFMCGYDETELPERLLGAVRLHEVDPTRKE